MGRRGSRSGRTWIDVIGAEEDLPAGATAMTHIAILERLDGKTVDWLEKVSDEEYSAGSTAD